ncbi:MAG: VRR-NUC protein [Podoviridae sp. ctrTa16]|nr:MAG: VRR-NUC protein [Podoviridae sp. ctrTa16]
MKTKEKVIPERTLQAKKIKQLERDGYYVIKLSKTNKNGIPDILAIPKNANVKFVEVKTSVGKVSELQKYRIAELLAHGVEVEVYRGDL